ncbi:TraR/DksA family transcriptional regulator [Arthrobacter mobilis]|uniref:TraR/DksA family transcriptional regulator n=1 Tax=Arthrobacter mobilis TaxID=2724944 RepID=A0A7X6HCD5_9MICC|nr:TraR/DksA C4-type zinc finger protein [Arthrobacter mobilis]NKX53147.1 TraR/DksA family transcriptional regulator [Arthrobacter mobilis]
MSEELGGTGAASAAPPEAYFRQLLEEKAAEARRQIERLTADIREVTLAGRDIPADNEYDPEGSTLNLERAREEAMLASTRTELAEVLDAQQRMDRGTYGVCERCGNRIPRERLEARPEARFCITCAGLRRRQVA